VETWEPDDDLTTIMGALMRIDETLGEVAENVAAIRALLEDEDEEEGSA
jgi:hypothetical protein